MLNTIWDWVAFNRKKRDGRGTSSAPSHKAINNLKLGQYKGLWFLYSGYSIILHISWKIGVFIMSRRKYIEFLLRISMEVLEQVSLSKIDKIWISNK